MNRQTRVLPAELAKQVRRTLEEWAATGKVRRLWARDATLWTGADEASWLGWLGIARDQVGRVDDLRRLAEDVRREGFTRALLLGMGGSSLAPEVLKETFGRIDGFPEVLVLDSTDPAQIKALERKVDLAKALFIVSSKSGTTLEPNIFKRYFFERASQVVGAERAGSRFIAITDPGSHLHKVADVDRFRRVFFGDPSIGGRYSALSDFGMVPAAVMGLDVYLRLASAPDEHQDPAVEALEGAGHPVVRITLNDLYVLGAEFFRWEFATAVAGSVLGVNAFNQPDVEASKVATRRLTDEYEKTGKLPLESPLSVSEGTLAAALGAHFRTIKPGDYVALLAYVEMSAAHEATLQTIRRSLRDRYRVATCLGFGPRFLHSTGQAYKGGPNTGVFLQVTCDDAGDLAVPGQTYTFGVVKTAQARGDFQVLVERGRRALRVHLGTDVADGLRTLRSAVGEALG